VEYILSERVIDFDAYSLYLEGIRDRLPPHVASFAGDERHFSLDAQETLHDAWLIEFTVREPAAGEREQQRATEIEVRLLGPFHDRVHALQYRGVRRYELVAGRVDGGHGDLYTHEVRLASDGVGLIHEYLFLASAAGPESRLLVECADFTHEMLPRNLAANRT
jgi:hypothetical protein